MAYIPPHKRHSNDSKVPSPIPDSLVTQYNKSLKLGSHHPGAERMKHKHALPGGKIVYADHATLMWFAVGTIDDGRFPSFVHLQPTFVKFAHQNEEERLVLVNSNLNAENIATTKEMTPWAFMADRIQADLFSSFQNLKKQMMCENLEVKPSFVARFGKVLFRRSPFLSGESARNCSITETTLRSLNRAFYTNLPTDMDNVIGGFAPKMGLNFEKEKDAYLVKLSDTTQPDSTIACKCRVNRDDNKLELYKIQLNKVRHMVVDISCLDKNLDLRLMLYTKTIAASLNDEEKNSIRALVNSAIVDPNVKGGLKWLSGEASSGDRYTVIDVWHKIVTYYRNLSMRLKVRNVDRFDFRASTGEATTEINLKLKGITSELLKHGESDMASDMLKENLKTIWDNFLSCGHSLET